MKYKTFDPPYDFQPLAAGRILDALYAPGPKRTRGFGSPTGSGKSSIWGLCLEREHDLIVSCPNPMIAAGIFEALTGTPKEDAKEAHWEGARIFTDKRLANCLSKGMKAPRLLGHDEGHHAVDETHGHVWDLCGKIPRVLLSATPYRGTPQSTEALRTLCDSWEWLLTLKEAVARRVITLPSFTTVPLLDDELISVVNGEFATTSTDAAVRNRVEAVVEYLRGFCDLSDPSNPIWWRAGTLVLSSVGSVSILEEALRRAGLPTATIIASTGKKERYAAFASTLAQRTLLLQIRAVGEGVDFPLRWIVDLAPTMSPMLWMQRVGRCTRPGGESLYVSLCHNLLRHGYLWEGLIPATQMVEARRVWGEEWVPSRKIMARALGTSGFGRFAPVEVPTVAGGTVYLYAIKAALDSYAALLLPALPNPLYYVKSDSYSGETGSFEKNGHTITYKKKTYGKWRRIERLPDLAGCASYENERVTEGAMHTWATHSRRCGLDPSHEPTAKTMTLLRILLDTQQGIR